MSLSFVAFVSCSDDKENEQSESGNIPENSSWVLSSSGKERGHSYVNLGLPSGTKWATCNVGAIAPQDYGNYYAWGEVTTKNIYYWDTYKYGIYNYDGGLTGRYSYDGGAYDIFFGSDFVQYHNDVYNYRCYGHLIRPVLNQEK